MSSSSSSAGKKPEKPEASYSSGPTIEFFRPVTRGELVKLCTRFATQLQALHNDKTVSVIPEGISEGGIRFAGDGYGGASDGAGTKYKSIRISIPNSLSWPWLTEKTVMTDWKDSDELLYPVEHKVSTVLKTYRGADHWTYAELEIFSEVCKAFGIMMTLAPAPAKPE